MKKLLLLLVSIGTLYSASVNATQQELENIIKELSKDTTDINTYLLKDVLSKTKNLEKDYDKLSQSNSELKVEVKNLDLI